MSVLIRRIGLYLATLSLLVGASLNQAQNIDVSVSTKNGESRPLREIAKERLVKQGTKVDNFADVKARLKRNAELAKSGEISLSPAAKLSLSSEERFLGRLPQTSASIAPRNTAVSNVNTIRPPSPNIPDTSVSFEGISNNLGVLPPDPTGDVGPNHYVQAVNLAVAIWDKAGTPLLAPVPTSSLWTGFGGICETNNDGDPIVLYDQFADRWLISQFALGIPDNFHQCIAISQTGDPTGAYYLYDFFYSDVNFNDYPHFGVWPDGYYMSVNQFNGATFAFTGGGAAAYERDQMLQGLPAQQVIFDLGPIFPGRGGFLPSDVDGMIPPPAGAPNYFVRFASGVTGLFEVYDFHVDWVTPANSTFTLNESIATNAFNFFPCATRNCIPQPAGSALDVIDDRLMFRAAYRNYGTHESLVANHTVDAGGGVAGIKWYEIRDLSTGTPILHQEGIFDGSDLATPDSDHRWMASLAMDAVGNIGLGYSVSSTSTFPSIRYTGRLESDPLGTMPQGEGEIVAGGGSQSHPSGRWGDYSQMSVDPVDDCTFWYTQEYYAADSTSSWQTRIGSFKFPNCVSGPAGTLSGTVTDTTTGDPIAGARVSIGAISSVTDALGNYSILLPVGDVAVNFRKFGFTESDFDPVSITEDTTTTLNATLTGLPVITQNGRVIDGSGHGWPLYARIEVNGVGGPTEVIFTDPITGEFSTDLFDGADYNVEVAAVVGGYDLQNISGPELSGDLSLLVNLSNCVAPGYRQNGLSETFNGPTFPPAGWASVGGLSGLDWRLNTEYGRTNFTGGSGTSAAADSDAFGPDSPYDAELISPEISIATLVDPNLQYLVDYNDIGTTDLFDLDISIDGGAFTNILSYDADVRATLVQQDLSTFIAMGASFRLRWRYYNADPNAFDWWAQIDDVAVGASCDLTAGGLIIGNTTDINNGNFLVGANVDDGNGQSTFSFATSEDANQNDGLFILFSELANPSVTASLATYADTSIDVTVVNDAIVVADIALNAGQLSSGLNSIAINAVPDSLSTVDLNLNNIGTAGLDYVIREANFAIAAPILTGEHYVGARHFGPKHLNQTDTQKQRVPFPELGIPSQDAVVINNFDTGLVHPWGLGMDINAELWTNNLGAAGGDDLTYHFDLAGVVQPGTFDHSAILGTDGIFVADITYNPFTGTFFMVKVSGDNCIYEMDPQALALTGQVICPAFGTSERGIAFDPESDTFWAGSWNDGVINRFDYDGNILESVLVNLGIAGMAYNVVSKHLFVLSNQPAAAANDITVFDMSDPDNLYNPIGGFEIPGISDFGQAGMTMNCTNGHLMVVDQNAASVIEIDVGETDFDCGFDVAWLDEDPAEGSILVDSSQLVSVNVDTTGFALGDVLNATLVLSNNTPYGSINVPVQVTLVENMLSLVSATYSAAEDAGTVTVELQRVQGSAGEISVDYVLNAGSAVAGSDYVDAMGTVIWADGDTANKTIDITIVDDSIEELEESFTLVLTNSQDAAFGATTETTITITNEDETGVIGLTGSSFSAREDAGTITVTVARTGGSDGPVTVDYSLSAGTATTGQDYTDNSGTLTWADGDAANKSITIAITNDNTREEDETLTVSIANVSAPGDLGSPTSATVTIENEDRKKKKGSMDLVMLMILFLLAGGQYYVYRRRSI